MDAIPSTTITCPRCIQLEAEILGQSNSIDELKKSVRDLTKKLDDVTRARKRQAAPFQKSKSQKKPKDQHKKPGRPVGHPPAQRPEPTPESIDRTIHVPANHCPDCNVALVDLHTERQFQTDIPEVKPKITEFVLEVGNCPCCQKRIQGTLPFLLGASCGLLKKLPRCRLD